MNNSIFSRFKKNNNPEVDEELSFEEDRLFWVNTLLKIAGPVLSNLKKGSLKKNMPYESINSERQKYSYLEAFGKLFCGMAPWLELGPDETEEGRIREKYIKLTLKSFENIVDPNKEDYLLFNEPKQSLVDAAFLAQGLLRSKEQIWFNLPVDIQARLIYELKSTRIIDPYENHWLLFASIIEAELLEFTGECDFKRLTKGVYKFRDNWYLGDGIYSDGPKYKVNYYNSLVIHPMLIDTLLVMHKYNINGNDFLNIELKRSSRYAAELERIISPEGTYPLVGESLAFRTGIFHSLSQSALLRILPKNIEPAQVRSALTKVLRVQFNEDQNFDNDGWLSVGLNGNQLSISEPEINTGSLYLCSTIFLPLGLSFNDSFWSSPFVEWSTLKAWNGNPIEPDKSIDF